MTDIKDLKHGDEVIAHSKSDELTVIHGVVDRFNATDVVSIIPSGHLAMHVCRSSYYTFEKVQPPIEFGVGALVSYGPNSRLMRTSQGHWHYIHADQVSGPSGMVSDTAVRIDYQDKKGTVHFWGIGITPPEGWVAP